MCRLLSSTPQWGEGTVLPDPVDDEAEIIALIDAVEEADPIPNPYHSLLELLRRTEELSHSSPSSADAQYFRGYALYLLWTRGFSIKREALASIERTLTLDPNHQWALFHAIALSYHLEKYSAVIDHMQRLDRSYFSTQDKDWRYLVAWEYELCARCRLGITSNIEPEISALIDEIVATDEDPDGWANRPQLLYELLNDLREGSRGRWISQVPTSLAGHIQRQLERLVPFNWFTADELE
jgi:hypothetical protein